MICFFFSSRRRHTRLQGDWSSDVCSSDLFHGRGLQARGLLRALQAGQAERWAHAQHEISAFARPDQPARPRRTPASLHIRPEDPLARRDRKSTRLNSSHLVISYAVFCLKKKKKTKY